MKYVDVQVHRSNDISASPSSRGEVSDPQPRRSLRWVIAAYRHALPTGHQFGNVVDCRPTWFTIVHVNTGDSIVNHKNSLP
jgi:hypothetical protein